jgi:hypothetical protein
VQPLLIFFAILRLFTEVAVFGSETRRKAEQKQDKEEGKCKR